MLRFKDSRRGLIIGLSIFFVLNFLIFNISIQSPLVVFYARDSLTRAKLDQEVFYDLNLT
ncbi:MAG: hypothetical protein ACXADY_18825 [Candidatus Hodarchaeales archaeon]|jgi:hypothetical protein